VVVVDICCPAPFRGHNSKTIFGCKRISLSHVWGISIMSYVIFPMDDTRDSVPSVVELRIVGNGSCKFVSEGFVGCRYRFRELRY
jgi:hypothetical protein